MRLSLVLAVLLAGCAESGARLGEEGVVELAYADGRRECESGCDPALPLAAGASAVMQIENGAVLPALEARSSDPSVFTTDTTTSRTVFLVDAHAPGRAVLELLDADIVLDRFRMEVREIRAVSVAEGSDATSPLTSEIRDIRFDLRDADGAGLRGFGALSVMAPENVRVDPLGRGERVGVEPTTPVGPNDEIIGLAGDLRGGSATVGFTAPSGARLDLVVPIAEPIVRRIHLTATSDENAVIVDAVIVLANAGPGIEGCCEWSFTPADASVYLNDPRCTRVRVASTDPSAPQRAMVRCAVGSMVQFLDVSISAAP